MYKFPSFKSAPKHQQAQRKEVKQIPPEPDPFFIDKKGDLEYFRYGKFKESIEYARQFDTENDSNPEAESKLLEIKSKGMERRKQPKEVDFISNDESLLKRLGYCVEEDQNGNLLSHPEILNLVSSSHHLELHGGIPMMASTIDLINWTLCDYHERRNFLKGYLDDQIVKNVFYHEEPLEQCPKAEQIYYSRLASLDFLALRIDDLLLSPELKHNCYPFYLKMLYESGRTERFIDVLQTVYEMKFSRPTYSEFPPIPQAVDEEYIVTEWLKTEREREGRFFYPLASNEKILIDDPLDDDPERIYIEDTKNIDVNKQNLFDYLRTEFYGLNPIIALINAKFKYLKDDPITSHLLDRDELLNVNLKGQFSADLFEKFCKGEATWNSFFRIRKWLAYRFFYDIKFYPNHVVDTSKILRTHFPEFNQRDLFEASLEINLFNTIIWLQYLKVTEKPRLVNIFYRAITTIPFCKELYMEGISRCINEIDNLSLIRLMENKGIRLRTFLEEFQP